MNTKILQRLSTIIAILLVIPLSILAIAASVSSAIEEDENKIPENDTPKTTKNKIVDGIYHFEGELNIADTVYFVAKDELFTYFQTNSRNGVDYAALNMGFTDFVKNITTNDGKEKYIKFAGENKASSYTKDGEEYTLLNETEFEFEYNGTEYTSAGINPLVKADEDAKTVTLYFPFYVENDDGTVDVTPLYIEAKLVYVENK